MKGIILFLLFSCAFIKSEASDVLASDLRLSFEGKDSLRIVLVVYRECSSVPHAGGVHVMVHTESGGQVQLQLDSLHSEVFPNFCANQKPICLGGSFSFGVQEYIYEKTLRLDSLFPALDSASCWIRVSFSECCRSANVTNLQPGNFYTEGSVNRCLAYKNSAPVFLDPPFSLFCTGQGFCQGNLFNHDVINQDSLSYEMVVPLKDQDSAQTYQGSFTKDIPLTFLGFPNKDLPFPAGFQFHHSLFDPLTLCFTTMGEQEAVIVIQVNEWRLFNGRYEKISVSRREMLFVSYTCGPNYPPEISVNGNRSGPWLFTVCPQQNTCLYIKASDKDTTATKSDTTLLYWNNGIAGASFVSINANGKVRRDDSAVFCWTPQLNQISSLPYYMTVRAADDHCPNQAITTKAIGFRVKGAGYKREYTQQQQLTYLLQATRNSFPDTPASLSWQISKGTLFDSSSTDLYSGDSVTHTFTTAGTYIILLKTIGSSGCTIQYYDTLVVVSLPSGSGEMEEDQLRIHPNPVKDELHISQGAGRELILFNLLGQVVMEQHITMEHEVVSLQHLPKACYVLLLKSKDSVYRYKLLKE